VTVLSNEPFISRETHQFLFSGISDKLVTNGNNNKSYRASMTVPKGQPDISPMQRA